MENTVVSFTPFQALLALAFQLWIIIFPIILIRKVNYLTNLFVDHFDADKESS